MSVNKVILVGRLGRDPETRYTGGGSAVANFSVATDETYKDKNGERQKRTEWHKIVVWGKQAEIAQKYPMKIFRSSGTGTHACAPVAPSQSNRSTNKPSGKSEAEKNGPTQCKP